MRFWTRIFNGLGMGSFIYLMSIIFFQNSVVTSQTIYFVFSISCFAGVMTIIFESDKFILIIAVVIHYLLVVGVVFLFNLFLTDNVNIVEFWISTTGFYVISYICVFIRAKMIARELNTYIQQINK